MRIFPGISRSRVAADVKVGVVSSGVLAVVAFGSLLGLARQLEVEEFARISLLLLGFNLTSVLDAVRPVMVYFGSHFRDKNQHVFSTSLIANCGLGIASGVVVFLAASFTTIPPLTSWDLYWLSAAFLAFFVQATFWGWLNANGHVGITMSHRAVVLGITYLVFLLNAWVSGPKWLYAPWLACVNVALLFDYLVRCVRLGLIPRWIRPVRDVYKPMLGKVWQYLKFSLSTLVLSSTDRLALSLGGSAYSLGMYSAHYEITTRPIALLRVIQTAVSPHMTRAASEGTDLFPAWMLFTKAGVSVVAVVAVVVAFFSREVSIFLLGDRYSEYAAAFAILVLAQPMVVLGYASAVLLNSHGDFSSQQRHYGYAGIVMLIGAVPAVLVGDVLGVACLYFLVRIVDLFLVRHALSVSAEPPPIILQCLTLSVWLVTALSAVLGSVLTCSVGLAALLSTLWLKEIREIKTQLGR